MAKPSPLNPAQRAEVVLALLRREEPASVLARRYGISTKTLFTWRDEFIAGGERRLSSSRRQKKADENRLVQLEAELVERDQVIGELTIANRILKKTADGLPLTKRFGKR